MEIQREKMKISDDLRIRGGDSDEILFDLIQEILKVSTVKTLVRFLCLSKQCASIIRNQDFIKSYLINSSTRPQGLIFTIVSKRHGKRFFFSSAQPQDRGDSSSSSSSSVATYHMKCHSQQYTTFAPSVHGLICYGPPSKLMVYNPSTRKSITLPKIDTQRMDMFHYLGYDPVDGDYKMLCMTEGRRRCLAEELQVLKLGNGNSWRTIEDFPPHSLCSPDICIDGVLYYGAFLDTDPSFLGNYQAVMSFDVRSEKLDLIEIPETARFTNLTSYEGKIDVMFFEGGRIELCVLVDAAKHEWTSMVFQVPMLSRWKCDSWLQAFCFTDAGEFVFAPVHFRRPPFYVLYCDPKENTLRRVVIEGITDSASLTISIFPGQVENLMFL